MMINAEWQPKMKAVDIDLAGVEKPPTGLCVLDENLNAQACISHSDRQIVEIVVKLNPKIVSVDAPLALPKGRPSLSAKYKNRPHLRECDKQLARMGIRFFPVTLGPMRKLTQRGIKLRKILEDKGFKVVESFPAAAQDMLGCQEGRRAWKSCGKP